MFGVGDAAWLFTFSKFSNAILLCLLPRLLLSVLLFLMLEADCNWEARTEVVSGRFNLGKLMQASVLSVAADW